MKDKHVTEILISILNKYTFTAEETEAIKHCIGILSWTTLRTSALKNLKQKKQAKASSKRSFTA